MIGNERKYFIAVNSVSASTGDTVTSTPIDCLGFDELAIVVDATSAATNKALSVLKLSESDDTTTTTTDITAFVGGGAGGFTIPTPSGATSAKPHAVFRLDLRGRKRYITVRIAPTTTQTFHVVAALGRAEQTPVSAAQSYADAVVAG